MWNEYNRIIYEIKFSIKKDRKPDKGLLPPGILGATIIYTKMIEKSLLDKKVIKWFNEDREMSDLYRQFKSKIYNGNPVMNQALKCINDAYQMKKGKITLEETIRDKELLEDLFYVWQKSTFRGGDY